MVLIVLCEWGMGSVAAIGATLARSPDDTIKGCRCVLQPCHRNAAYGWRPCGAVAAGTLHRPSAWAFVSFLKKDMRAVADPASVELLRESARLMPGNPAAQHALGESLLAVQTVEALHLEAALAEPSSVKEYYRGKALLASYRVAEASSSLLRAKDLAHGYDGFRVATIKSTTGAGGIPPSQRATSQPSPRQQRHSSSIGGVAITRPITIEPMPLVVGTEEEAGRRQLPLRICAVADAPSRCLERA